MRFVNIKGMLVPIPTAMRIIGMPHTRTPEILREITLLVGCSAGRPAHIDFFTLKDGGRYCLTTKALEKHVYWTVTPFNLTMGRGEVLAGGSFQEDDPEYRGESAVARPHMRGRGLYSMVLRRIRRVYKRPLISSYDVSKAALMSWIRAGGVPNERRGGYHINPACTRIPCFLALEMVRR